ncbi:SusF/SusE family outer membrane protein [Bacteroides sp. OttesenSCG-928-E20]|nr:SusF/SusE family outer membrane protein [Bacteroides sp. OttesenSCG-928-N06]MDL2299546.1 SusF/SusE family outer membrane protein [Bacteroides sp. OttesenSCG-928-E20]
MKKLIISALLLSTLCFFTACDSDRDSNPTIQQPTTFVLNEPAYTGALIDLETSSKLPFSFSQPNYGYTAAVNYQVQVSLTDTYTVSAAERDAAEEAGETLTADYITLDNAYTNVKIDVEAESIAKALVQLTRWTEEGTPNEQNMYVRILANVDKYEMASNSVMLNVAPYYIELKDALPEMWYLIGACIGDGAWTNSIDGIGASMYPMSLVKDYTYDKKTGQGELTFTGYLTPDGFKLVKTPGDWNDQWGMNDGAFVKNDGGSGNITVDKAGYYTVSLNTATNEMSVVEYAKEPKVFGTMGLIGDWNDWGGDEFMTASSVIEGTPNHVWYTKFTFGDTAGKFRADSDWADNWGAEGFPYGIGESDGDNVSIAAGTYIVTFNDIDGGYAFISLD